MKMKLNALIKKIFSILPFLLTAGVAFAEDDGDFERSCPTLDEYAKDGIGDGFVLGPAYKAVIRTGVKIANGSWDAFAGSLQGVVAVGAAIYIALYTLRNIGAVSQQDPAAYLSNEKTGVISVGIKTAIVVSLLSSSSIIYGYLIGPVVSSGMEIGSGNFGSSFSSAGNLQSIFDAAYKQVLSYNNKIYRLIGMGRILWCIAGLPDNILEHYWTLYPIGAILYVYGWILLIGVSFYFLDVIFRLAVGCMVLPMAIACGFSKLTSSYTRSTWNLFVNVCFSFIIIGVVISLTTQMISVAIGSTSADLTATLNKGHLNKAQVDDLVANMDIKACMMTALCCVLSFTLFMQIDQVIEGVSSAKSVGKAGQQMGAKTAQVGMWLLKKGSHPIRGVAKAQAQQTGDAIAVSKPVMAVRKGYRQFKSAVKTMTGLD